MIVEILIKSSNGDYYVKAQFSGTYVEIQPKLEIINSLMSCYPFFSGYRSTLSTEEK